MNDRYIREQLATHGLQRCADQILAAGRHCALLTSIRDKAKKPEIGASKLGGCPDLPNGFEWPTKQGTYLSFLAQLNLVEVASLQIDLRLPTTGLLSFFYDADSLRWGFDPEDSGHSRVFYFENQAVLERRETPEELEDDGWFLECHLTAEGHLSVPGFDSDEFPQELDEDETNSYIEFRDSLSEPRHQLGGHADAVQGPMELECQLVTNGLYCGDATGYSDPRAKELAKGARDWRLLLQIDTDEDADMMWGDCGRLYYWIRKQDLERLGFSQTWTILQCY